MWEVKDFLRQSPGRRGEWNGVRFSFNEPGPADFVIVHYWVREPITVDCPANRVWVFLGEPPSEPFIRQHRVPSWASRVYGNDAKFVNDIYRLSHPALPWSVDRDYDWLKACSVPEKSLTLSWITSNRSDTSGHRYRMKFLERRGEIPELQLFGRGHEPVKDKWDALAQFKYSIAFENYSNSHYWTEKVMDCFLAWSMPIYYGCTDLSRFFPKESFVQLSPDDPMACEKVREIVNSDLWRRNQDAIAEARRLVLEKYNFLAFAADQIINDCQHDVALPPSRVRLTNHAQTAWEQLRDYRLRPGAKAVKRLLSSKSVGSA